MSLVAGPAQSRLWFLDRLLAGDTRFVLHAIFHVEGRIEKARLEEALVALTERHPGLRARFVEEDEVPVVHHDAPPPTVDEIDDDGELVQLAFSHKDRPMSLADGPLVRARIVRRKDGDAIFFAVHHIVADGRSLGVLFAELGKLYSGEALPPVPAHFRDLPPPDLREASVEVWRARMNPPPAPLPLFQDGDGVIRTGALVRAFTAEQLAAIDALGPDRKTTLYAIAAALLGLHAGSDDVLLGAPEDPDPRPIIGPIGRMVPLRVDLSRSPSLREVVRRVAEVRAEAAAYPLPFERIIELVHTERDLKRPPLLEVLVAFPPLPIAPVAAGGITLTFGGVQRTAAYDLVFAFPENGAKLVVEHNRTRFDDAHVARIADHFGALVVADPDRPITSSMLEAPRPITTSPATPPVLAHALFERWAKETPSAEALVGPGVRWTYAEVEARANRLAHTLVQSGVTRGDAVGVHLPNSVEAIVALLAIDKAGGAFLSLNPEYPSARLAAVIDDARPSLVITQRARMDALPAVTTLLVDDERIARSPSTPLSRRLHAHDLSYLVFTSGSTGRPKGVAIEHVGLANMTEAMGSGYDVQRGDRVLQFASVSFDAFVSEVLMALGRGATLVVPDSEQRRPGRELFALLADERITTITLPPSVLAMLPDDPPATLRTIVSAGEALSRPVATRYARRGRLVNGYGPSEATVCSTMGEVAVGETPTLGRALPGTRVYVLDRDLQRVASGLRGEVYVAGVHVGRGYVGRPDLTAERFLPDPFEPGARMYRTGDVGRLEPDGRLAFLGRVDHQVKLRGFRIELGEIEAVLRKAPGVRDALVVLRDEALCAYVLAADTNGLVEECQAKLPAFMVPSAFVALPAWPLSANDKIDRNALPLPVRASRVDLWGPRTPTERAVLAIAESLLKTSLSVADDFFLHGGHSLVALRFSEALSTRLRRRVPLRLVFEARTFEKIAAMIDEASPRAKRSPSDPSIVTLKTGTGHPLFLIPPVHGYPYCYVELVRRMDDRTVYSFQAPGLEGECAPLSSLPAMGHRYVPEILAAQPTGPYQLAGWSSGGAIAFEVAQQLLALGHEVSFLGLIDSTAPTPEHLVEARLFVRDYPPEIIGYIYTKNLGRSAGIELPIDTDTFKDLDEKTYLDGILAVLKRFRVVDDDMTIDGLRPLLAVFSATLKAFHAYRPQLYSPRLTVLESETANLGYVKPSWQMFAAQPLDATIVPGDHYNVIYPPFVERVVEVIRERLR